MSGDVQTNPGPRITTYPCGFCKKKHTVRYNQDGVACDECNEWYNRQAMHMNSHKFKYLQNSNVSWTCCNCENPKFSSDLFLNSSIETSENRYSPLSLPSDTSPQPSLSVGSPTHTSSPIKDNHQKNRPSRKLPPELKVLTRNCNSLKSLTKFSQYHASIDYHDPDIIIGCGSKLSREIPRHSILPLGYTTFRKDRSIHGGGVFISIKMKYYQLKFAS